MPDRAGALKRAETAFDSGAFRDLLGRLVAIRSTSQDPGHEADCEAYLDTAIRPWAERLGFSVAIHPNPEPGFGPILTGSRIEAPGLPTALLYGHGDTVRGLEDQWSPGLEPWALTERDGRWYGRGTADNKGQHALNLAALEAVIAEREGKLGFNMKLVLEMSEERGSKGLRAFVGANKELLAADVLIASDGPRVAPGVATIATGTRGTYHFDLVLKLRQGGVHSGHWGGLTTDPAVVMAHAIASIMDRHGKILVDGWLPAGRVVPNSVRAVLAGCPVESGGEGATIDADWGEPGLSAAEKIYGWNSFIVLAMVSGRPENPVNAVAPEARAHCQIRYTVDTDPETFGDAVRKHLDAQGFPEVAVENAFVRMAASRTDPANPWVQWARASMEKSLGAPVQVIPNSSGGLPGDVFIDHLGTPLVWVPHSYNGCKQHGPDEHLLPATAREGIRAFAGMWWDMGEPGSPARK
ncbi:acetylornithine deacetylase/succinyl-diaminopimelate desuccinylase-like protein [Humitalea rosea]|uniref:Acetylornithine deacetylase/succinyl-diaminopimelate desuccinylase-like protein n=1 Tax=Humitalea rosea TaxID=990373 RepID=A0A2W7I535_9PROT|nr:M20/M25/M40 family metallo-hydrolase [Humitalea rosea]PZW41348.1 acetylornithine deacetylase/succinyl-diaminopimelate desuccinylase-like protein [Humitalea rosea]